MKVIILNIIAKKILDLYNIITVNKKSIETH